MSEQRTKPKQIKTKLWYLASPYSHEDVEIRIDRYKTVCKAASWLMNQGFYILAPIAHSHGIAEYGSLPTGWDFWGGYDRALIERCDGIIVCCMDGWDKSIGVLAEIKIAESLGHQVGFLTYSSDTYSLRLP